MASVSTRRHRRLVRPNVRSNSAVLSERLEERIVLSTFVVTTTGDSGAGSLRDAVTKADAAPGPDTISFGRTVFGTIMLASPLDVTDDLDVRGPGAFRLSVSGNDVTRVFHVTGAATDLSIEDLRIANGMATVPGGTAYGGAILNDGASVKVERVLLQNNQASGKTAGGGAVANLGGKFVATSSAFFGNSAHSLAGNVAAGGALYNDSGAVATVNGSTFFNNSAVGGNANGGAMAGAGGSQTTVNGSFFDGNKAEGDADDGAGGGAIEVQSSQLNGAGTGDTKLNLSHDSFANNLASVRDADAGKDVGGQANGGAVELEDGVVATVDQSVFEGNRSLGGDGGDGAAGAAGGAGGATFGGAINSFSATLTLSRSQFSGNLTRAGSGGKGGDAAGAGGTGGAGGDGAFAIGGAVSASSLAVVPFRAPTTTIDHCLFTDNRAVGGNGGAGGSGAAGGFASRGDGGGVGNLFGNMSVSDSSIAFNSARGGKGGAPGAGAATGTTGGDGGLARGGGFTNERGGTATLTHVWLALNSAVGGAGGDGGNGGDALGGGAFNGRPAGLDPAPDQVATLNLKSSNVLGNLARGGAGGAGANGGNGFGGGIFNGDPVPVPGSPVLHLIDTLVTFNRAIGGAAGSGTGATAGEGRGGGLYNQLGAVATKDSASRIRGNRASTGDDDIFGTVTPA